MRLLKGSSTLYTRFRLFQSVAVQFRSGNRGVLLQILTTVYVHFVSRPMLGAQQK